MIFESTHIKGKGRGRPMGFPTINLKIPENFALKDGIYAVKVTIDNKKFTGALHYGPTPTFSELEKALEVYLIGLSTDEEAKNKLAYLNGKIIKVEIIKYLRNIVKFRSVASLVEQISEDVSNIKKMTNDKIQISNE